MVRRKLLVGCAALAAAVLFLYLWAARPAPGPAASASGPPAAKKTAEALAREWSFNPADAKKKLQSWGHETVKSSESLVVVSARLEDQGKASVWFDLFARFYAEKCGSEQDPVKSENGKVKHILGLNGVSKTKGRYLITEPAIMSTPLSQIAPRPNSLLFAHHDADGTVTVMLWRQDDDVLLIALTVAVR
jgi:hypothetical protein